MEKSFQWLARSELTLKKPCFFTLCNNDLIFVYILYASATESTNESAEIGLLETGQPMRAPIYDKDDIVNQL